jgi:hypothetical protein
MTGSRSLRVAGACSFGFDDRCSGFVGIRASAAAGATSDGCVAIDRVSESIGRTVGRAARGEVISSHDSRLAARRTTIAAGATEARTGGSIRSDRAGISERTCWISRSALCSVASSSFSAAISDVSRSTVCSSGRTRGSGEFNWSCTGIPYENVEKPGCRGGIPDRNAVRPISSRRRVPAILSGRGRSNTIACGQPQACHIRHTLAHAAWAVHSYPAIDSKTT